jgi:hypothetical protein
VNVTEICALPGVTPGGAGADGTVLGMTTADAGDVGLVPLAFVALTVQVYDFPFDNPPTAIGEAAPFAEPGMPPFDDVQLAA